MVEPPASRSALGRLEEVDALEVWRYEERELTPWLLENADALSDALGVSVELTQREHRVGPFELDLLGRDLTHDATLIVENQLTATDHGHLGQLMTYAAGTDAATIVWLATKFREPHRQALDWMNERTDERTRFFGVEVRVVRIGSSLPAPNFKVVSAPNDWQKVVRQAAGSAVSPRSGQYLEFWGRLLERVNAERAWTPRRQGVPTQNWLNFRSERFHPSYYAMSFARGGRLRHELYIDLGSAERSTELFERLRGDRTAIEARVGEPLEWEPLPGKQVSRVALYTDGGIDEADRYDEAIDWFLRTGDRLRSAFDDA